MACIRTALTSAFYKSGYCHSIIDNIAKPSTDRVTDISRGTSCGNQQEGEVFLLQPYHEMVSNSETGTVTAQNSLKQCLSAVGISDQYAVNLLLHQVLV